MSSDLPVLSSFSSSWGSIQVEQHTLLAGECPELELQQHSITIQLGQPFEIDWRLAGEKPKRTQMSFGDVSITPSGIPTQAHWYKSIEFLLISMSPQLIERAIAESIDTSLVEMTPARGVRDPQILHIGLALKAELEAGCCSGSLYGESLGLALAVHLLKRYSTLQKPIREPSSGLSRHKLQQAIDYINDNLAAIVTLAEMADVAKMSPYYFARQFKLSTGLSPHQYLIQRRIELAKVLLAENKLPIIEIVAIVGSSSQSNFTTLFHKHTGMTPKAYQEKTRWP